MTKLVLMCFFLNPPPLHKAINHSARTRAPGGRVQVCFASRQNKAGASQRERERELASGGACFMNESPSTTAGRTHPDARVGAQTGGEQ